MKVRELIEKLQALDPEMEAVTENAEYGFYHSACCDLTLVRVEKMKSDPGEVIHVFHPGRKRKSDVTVVVI